MYIRIQDNTIRFRLSKEEAETLLHRESLVEKAYFSPQSTLNYSVQITGEQNNFLFDDAENSLQVYVNEDLFKEELANRPSKEGILIARSVANDQLSQVTLEIDLKRKRSSAN